jgi:methylenetetrahydrofolate dehydrogenase (NADP+)/methenyltetrahydrofolate cyclohydrolase
MIIDGKAVAEHMYRTVAKEVALLSRVPVLAAITCAPNFETKKYLELKKRKAREVGISLRVIELPETATTDEAVACIEAVLPAVDGVVVQLPFPAHIDRETLLAVVPVDKDPDGFSYGRLPGACVPPVPLAISVIAEAYNITLKGRLVGKPTAQFLRELGAAVSVVTEDTVQANVLLAAAEIIVSGIGKPHFITPDMVATYAAVFDAGTSEDGGLMVGDVHPDVAGKVAYITPVPGGIGPVTVAALLQNLVTLAKSQP